MPFIIIIVFIVFWAPLNCSEILHNSILSFTVYFHRSELINSIIGTVSLHCKPLLFLPFIRCSCKSTFQFKGPQGPAGVRNPCTEPHRVCYLHMFGSSVSQETSVSPNGMVNKEMSRFSRDSASCSWCATLCSTSYSIWINCNCPYIRAMAGTL